MALEGALLHRVVARPVETQALVEVAVAPAAHVLVDRQRDGRLRLRLRLGGEPTSSFVPSVANLSTAQNFGCVYFGVAHAFFLRLAASGRGAML